MELIVYNYCTILHGQDLRILIIVGCIHCISRYTVVCRAAQEAGAPHREYIDRKKENVIFTPLHLGDSLSD